MNNKNKPAFPPSVDDPKYIEGHKEWCYGLTKREYFAGLAMQGMLANPLGGITHGGTRTLSPYGISKLALEHADCILDMMKE